MNDRRQNKKFDGMESKLEKYDKQIIKIENKAEKLHKKLQLLYFNYRLKKDKGGNHKRAI